MGRWWHHHGFLESFHQKGNLRLSFVGLKIFRYLMNIPDIDVVFNTFFIAAP